MSTVLNTQRFEGIYNISEAARYLYVDIRLPDARYRVKNSHLIRWIRMGLSDPKLKAVPGRKLLITFEDLVSMRVVAFLRALNYSFKRIRMAEASLREITRYARPFATDDIWAEKKGRGEIFSEMASDLLVATKHGQLAFRELLQEHLTSVHGLTFDVRGIADSWTPYPGIRLDPQIQFGSPCISGTRIPTHDISGMVEAGDSLDFLARSYGITQSEIETALAWEAQLVTS